MSLADRWHSAILKNSLDLMRYDAQQRTEILAMLRKLGRDLVAELASAELDTPRTDWQRARLRKLLEEASRRVDAAYQEISTAHTDGLAQAMDASAGSLVVALNEVAGLDLLSPVKWTAEQLAALASDTLVNGAPSAEWWSRQADSLKAAFADQMRKGMLQGEGITELRNRILGYDLPGVNAVGKVDLRTIKPEARGLIKIARQNAEALVRTSAMAVNNAAQMALWDANSDIISKLQWTATLDPRTCVTCGTLDGQTWDLGAPQPSAPIHWNCRCCKIPITKTWEELATKNKALARQLDQMPEGTRSSWVDPKTGLGGQVSASTTWESWLGGQSRAVQEDVLGPARLKLWDSGQLTLRDLVDQRGNPLTLEQLRSR